MTAVRAWPRNGRDKGTGKDAIKAGIRVVDAPVVSVMGQAREICAKKVVHDRSGWASQQTINATGPTAEHKSQKITRRAEQ